MRKAIKALLAFGVAHAHAIRLGAVVPSSREVLRCRAPVMHDDVTEAPVSLEMLSEIQKTVAGLPVVLFSKTSCAASTECKGIFDSMDQPYTVIELDQREDSEAMEAALLSLTQRTIPNVFVGGQLLGGDAEMQEAAATGLLCELLEGSSLSPAGCVVPTRGPRSAQ